MKKFKYILTSIIFMLMLFVPVFALVGCAKHFKVNIAIVPFSETEVGGDVVSVTQLTHQKRSLVGTNDVLEGSKFEYSVVPDGGYVIDYIKVDGITLEYGTDYTTSALDLDETYGIARLLLSENIQESHNIEVKFKLRPYYLVTYEYREYDSENAVFVYKKLLNNDGTVYTRQSGEVVPRTYQASFETPGYLDFGFLYTYSEDKNDSGFPQNDTTFLTGDAIFYTTKTKAELKTFLGL